MSQETFKRPASDNELLYVYMQEQFSSLTINLIVEGEGRIDPDELQEAVERASNACPGSRLVLSKGMWVDSQRSPQVLLIPSESHKVTFDNIDRLDHKMDPKTGPNCEVLMFQSHATVLVFRVFHGIMDGKGVLLWIQNIFRALKKEEVIPIEGKETDLSFMKLHKPYNRRHPLKFNLTLSEDQRPAHPKKIWRKRLTIPGNPSCLVAKIAEVMTEQGTSFHNRFLIPVDLRRHDRTHLSNANLTLPIFLETTKSDSWSTIHKNLLSSLKNHDEMNLKSANFGFLNRMPKRLVQWGLRSLNTFQHLIHKRMIGGIISDLGMIDLEALSFSGFQAKTVYSSTVQQPFAPFTVAVASNKNSVEIVISCYENQRLIEKSNMILLSIKEKISSSLENLNRNYPSDKTLVDLIEQQANRHPDAIAFRMDGNITRYSALCSQVNQIAQYLSQQGVGPEESVILYMSRSSLLIPSILAVLKTGATYIPIDPATPTSQLDKRITQTDAIACITEENLKSNLTGVANKPLIVIDRVDFSNHSDQFTSQAKPSNIAYQIYTSGSTGVPKGVQIQHRSLVNYLFWAKEYYQVNERSVFPLFASIAFDSTLTSMFLPLIAGGSIEIFPDAITHMTFRRIVESNSISHIKLSPAHLQLMVNTQSKPGQPKSFIVGGDQLTLKLARNVHDLYGTDWKIYNEYGPTEATIGCIVYPYLQNGTFSDHAVPIGKPISNTKVYLFDRDRQPVPCGEIGEIYLSGHSLSFGYKNDSALTDQKYIYLDSGERVYRTGDLAYLNPEGDLVYVGRADDQLCIHGNRIEAGEIESAVLAFPEINEAVVVSKKNRLGVNTLMLFYTSHLPIDELRLKNHLTHTLPKGIQIHLFQRMESMPLTQNHKIDRKSLPFPNIDRISNPSPSEPFDSIDETLAQIWREALELGNEVPIHPNDNFYHLGGDSLALLTVYSEIVSKLVGIEKEMQFMEQADKIIASPTLKSFSKIIRKIMP